MYSMECTWEVKKGIVGKCFDISPIILFKIIQKVNILPFHLFQSYHTNFETYSTLFVFEIWPVHIYLKLKTINIICIDRKYLESSWIGGSVHTGDVIFDILEWTLAFRKYRTYCWVVGIRWLVFLLCMLLCIPTEY